MIWKQDKLRPTQPFFVLGAENFYQEVYLRQGISHFYTFNLKESKTLIAVPDGCVDIQFEYQYGEMRAYACGSVLSFENHFWEAKQDVFGVRFMPGVQPAGLNISLRELLNQRVPLVKMSNGNSMIELMKEQQDFYQRIRVFLQEYTKLDKKEEKPYGKKELTMTVKNLVYDSDGMIKISELREQTGYSERYINKVFIEQMGFSPKTFCKIIQFQRALEYLNYGAPGKMTKAAVDLGYYDQSQFIRDFKAYAGLTPKQYLTLIKQDQYRDRVKDTHYF